MGHQEITMFKYIKLVIGYTVAMYLDFRKEFPNKENLHVPSIKRRNLDPYNTRMTIL